jgi:hypothetical protein
VTFFPVTFLDKFFRALPKVNKLYLWKSLERSPGLVDGLSCSLGEGRRVGIYTKRRQNGK